MDLGSFLLIIALLLIVGIYVSRPLMEKSSEISTTILDDVDHQRSTLMAERDRILNALQELDFDHALGKVPEKDYPKQRIDLLDKGAEVLRELDILLPSTEVMQTEDRLEAVIAAHRKRVSQSPLAENWDEKAMETPPTSGKSALILPDDDLELILADRRRARKGKAAGFCPKCGGPLQKSDQFCPKCGHKIT